MFCCGDCIIIIIVVVVIVGSRGGGGRGVDGSNTRSNLFPQYLLLLSYVCSISICRGTHVVVSSLRVIEPCRCENTTAIIVLDDVLIGFDSG